MPRKSDPKKNPTVELKSDKKSLIKSRILLNYIFGFSLRAQLPLLLGLTSLSVLMFLGLTPLISAAACIFVYSFSRILAIKSDILNEPQAKLVVALLFSVALTVVSVLTAGLLSGPFPAFGAWLVMAALGVGAGLDAISEEKRIVLLPMLTLGLSAGIFSSIFLGWSLGFALIVGLSAFATLFAAGLKVYVSYFAKSDALIIKDVSLPQEEVGQQQDKDSKRRPELSAGAEKGEPTIVKDVGAEPVGEDSKPAYDPKTYDSSKNPFKV